jgi:threonylcarbamoyladenosine tRNA methylthiotransferase MtaB
VETSSALYVRGTKRTQSYYITTNGCRARQIEASRIAAFLEANGLQRTDNIGQARIVVLASCAFNGMLEEKTREIVARIRQQAAPGAKLLITGCYPPIAACGRAPAGFTFVDPDEEPDRISALLGKAAVRFGAQPRGRISVTNEVFPSEYAANEHFVAISRGCLNNCSYCVIKRARGSLKSRSLAEIEAEVRGCVEQHQDRQKINFVGDDVGAYGRDVGSNFSAFAHFVVGLKGDFTIGLDHSGPQWFLRDYAGYESLAATHRLHNVLLGIQSGSRPVLRRMRRPYDIEAVTEALVRFASSYPDVVRAIHLIVGFPGETDKDFERTLAFVAKVRPQSIGVFPFSPRAGTDAALLPQLPRAVISERVRTLELAMEKLGARGCFWESAARPAQQ